MQLKLDHTAFEKEIEERGIEYLIHFTPTINLMGIFELGKLLSRALLENAILIKLIFETMLSSLMI